MKFSRDKKVDVRNSRGTEETANCVYVCVCVCMYVCVCVYVYVCVCMYVYIYIYICVCVCMYVCMYVWTYVTRWWPRQTYLNVTITLSAAEMKKSEL